MSSLKNFFNPKKIAVVGASRDPKKVGGSVFKNLISNPKLKVYPVNPNSKTIQGQKSYPQLASPPHKVDLVVVCVPAKLVNQVVKQSASQDIKNLVVISSGFSESGPKGKKRETQLTSLIKNHQLNLLGPNTLGFINKSQKINCSFAQCTAKPGGVSFVSQSGAFATTFSEWADKRGVGIDHLVCLGNKAGISEAQVLEYLSKTKSTQVVAMYLESFSNPRKFVKVSQKLKGKKPLVVFKSGQTKQGQKSAASHTGKMAGPFEAAVATVEAAKGLLTKDIDVFLTTIYLLSRQVHINHKKVLIVTNAGGPGVITADEAIEKKWKLINLSSQKNQLKSACPQCASLKNPIDIGGDASPERLKSVLNSVSQSSAQNLLIIITPQAMTQVPKMAQTISQYAKTSQKNLIACFLGGKSVDQAEAKLKNSNVPLVSSPEQALEALDEVAKLNTLWQSSDQIKPFTLSANHQKRLQTIVKKAKSQGREYLNQTEVQEFAQVFKVPLPPQAFIKSFFEAKEFVKQHQFPVVLKLDLLHKTEHQGVVLNISSLKDLKTHLQKLKKDQPYVIIQKQVKTDLEMIVGLVNQAKFGPLLNVGLGGVYTEVFNIGKSALAPVGKSQTHKLLKDLDFYPALKSGFRGQTRPTQKIIDLIWRFSYILPHFNQLKSAEINPLIITPKNLFALDFRILI